MIEYLLEEQQIIRETTEFDLDGYIELVSVEKEESNLELQYKIHTGIDDDSAQLWQVVCHEIREHRILLGEQYDDFELFDNHVLLWFYSQPKSSLTFKRIDSNVDAFNVIGKLYAKHRDLVGSWIPFEFCFNQDLNLEVLLNLGYGKLAEGAEKIIIGYQEVMNECGFQSSYLSYPPKRWDEEKGWIDEDSNLRVLITGQSYIVAPKFTAKRIIN